jgi:putative addiction module component (TIGR02574 family)
MSADLSQFDGLSLPQKLEIVEALWDDIAESTSALPIPEWHKEELDRREAENAANPTPGIPWEEAKRQIRSAE